MKLCGAKLDVIRPITDADRASAFHTTELFAATDPASQVVDLTDAWREHTQGSQNCVEVAECTKADMLATIQGQPLPDRGAAALLYGRTQDRQGLIVPGVGLKDEGSACGWAIAEMIERGVPAESAYPDTAENGKRIPPLGAWELPPLYKVAGAHRLIFEDAADPETTLLNLLAVAFGAAKAGAASVNNICMFVDDAYGNLPEGAVYGTAGNMPGGKVWGGHSQAAVYFDPINKILGLGTSWGGRRVFKVSIPWLAHNGGGAFVLNGLVRST